MSYKCFSNQVEIAMIGISNAGKSTFIGTLFEDSICKLLRKIALENKGKGQTKVPVHYHLNNKNSSEGLVMEKIEWNEEIIIEAISVQDSKHSIANKVCKDLGIVASYKEKMVDRDSLVENLKEIESDVFKQLSIEELFSNYINNIDFQESGIVKNIYLVGKPSSILINLMEEFKFDHLIIRDTKGLLDENFETLMEKRNNLTEKGTSEDEENRILAERGLIGVNACILMNGTNATITDGIKELYATIFNVVANKMPTFLVERSAVLSQRFATLIELGGKLDETSYTKALADNKVTRYNFNNMERILEEYGINNNPETISEELVKRNFKKMLLADIADSMQKCDEDDDAQLEYKAYVFTVNTVMKELLESLSKLRQTIQTASEVFSSNKKVLVNAFMKSYQNYFIEGITLYNKEGKQLYDSSAVKDMYCDTIASKVLGYDNFYGRTGMLGVQGGLTYSYDKKLYTIAILKSGKCAIEAILNALVNNGQVAQPLLICLNNIFTDNVQIRLAIGNLYILLNDYILNGYSEEIISFNTGRIINRVYLKDACEKIRNDGIGTTRYYTIFKQYNNDRNVLSVVYGIVYKLLYGFICTVDDNAISDNILEDMLLVR